MTKANLLSSFILLFASLISSFILSDLFQQRIYALRLFFDRVAHEMKHGSMPQVERESKLLSHIRARVSTRSQCQLMFLLISLNGHVNAGVSKVVGNSHLSYGDHC